MRRLAAVAAALAAGGAFADVFDTFGFSPRATAMSGAMTAEATDYTASFYNPALLIRSPDATFGATVSYFAPLAEVSLQEPPDTELWFRPPATTGVSLGIAGPLGGKLNKRVALGIGAHVPFQKLVRVQMPNPDKPFWYHYQSHSERLELFAGIAVKIFDWLQLGLGVQALADLKGENTATTVDLFSKQVTARSIDAELRTRVAPNVGLIVQPIPSLRFGFTYRSEMMLNVSIPATVNLEGVGELMLNIEGTTHFSPHTFNLGVAWDITPEFTLALDGSYQMWSRTPSPYLTISIDVGGDVLEKLGLDAALDVVSPSQPAGFQDTITGKIGAEYRLNKRFAARAGGFYRPTPVPKQNISGSNVLDGTTVGGTVGIGFNFDDPLEVFAAPITIDLAGMAAAVLPREAVKEPFDRVPSYSYSAKIFGVNAAIRYDF